MAARFSRLVSAVAAGGVLSGALLFGAGVAAADEGSTIPARCGQTVEANPGDTVSVLTPLGTHFPISVGGNSAVVQQAISGLICRVGVQVVAPVTQVAPQLVQVVPRYVPTPGAAQSGAGSAPSASKSGSSSASAPASKAAAAPAPAAAQTPVLVPLRPVPAAPATAFPSFGQSQLASFGAAPGIGTAAPAGLRSYDSSLLFGSAFPSLRSGAPAYLGYDPASAVTTASQVQALSVDGLSAGLGVPAVLAVLAFAGVAALIVRRGVLARLQRAAAPAAAATPPFQAPDVTDDAVFQDGPLRS